MDRTVEPRDLNFPPTEIADWILTANSFFEKGAEAPHP